MNRKRILLIETGFFIFYFLILDLLTYVQMHYAGYVKDTLSTTVVYRLLFLPLYALYFLFYQYPIKKWLLQKKYVLFAVSVLLFIGLLECFLPVMDRLIYYAPFLSQKVRATSESVIKDQLFPRQVISLTLVNITVLSGLSFLIKTFNDEMNMRKLREHQLQLELNSLKSQLQPHFFFNTLNNIYSLALQNKKETAPVIAQLSQLMRYIIYDCKEEQVPLCKEVYFIENYIKLEQIRHGNNTTITFAAQGYTKEVKIAPLLFLPLVENAFKHSINNTTNHPWMDAVLVVVDNEIIFEVKNSCTANVPAAQEEGIGLQNIRKRLQLLYPGKHSMRINKTTTSHEVYVNLFLQ